MKQVIRWVEYYLWVCVIAYIIGTFAISYYNFSTLALFVIPYPFFYLAFKQYKKRNLEYKNENNDFKKSNKKFLLYLGIGFYIIKPIVTIIYLYMIELITSEIMVDPITIGKPIVYFIYFFIFCVISIRTHNKTTFNCLLESDCDSNEQ